MLAFSMASHAAPSKALCDTSSVCVDASCINAHTPGCLPLVLWCCCSMQPSCAPSCSVSSSAGCTAAWPAMSLPAAGTWLYPVQSPVCCWWDSPCRRDNPAGEGRPSCGCSPPCRSGLLGMVAWLLCWGSSGHLQHCSRGIWSHGTISSHDTSKTCSAHRV